MIKETTKTKTKPYNKSQKKNRNLLKMGTWNFRRINGK